MHLCNRGGNNELIENQPSVSGKDLGIGQTSLEKPVGGASDVLAGPFDAEKTVARICLGGIGEEHAFARADLDLHGSVITEEGSPVDWASQLFRQQQMRTQFGGVTGPTHGSMEAVKEDHEDVEFCSFKGTPMIRA